MLSQRITWLDYAKAISIALVVMMHSVRGVGDAMGGEGFMHGFVAFTDPFRIPTFFLLAGLLADRAASKSWASLLDRKVAFYAYFYVLWVTIQFAFKAPLNLTDWSIANVAREFALALANPETTLWFIAVLPLYFIVAKLTRALPIWLVLLAAAALLASPVNTGWLLLDLGSNGLFFFLLGQRGAPLVFSVTRRLSQKSMWAFAFVVAWAIVAATSLTLASTPGFSIIFALLGAAAIIAIAVLLQNLPLLGWLRWIGQNTLVIYLAFFLPMAVTRIALVGTALFDSVGLVSLIVWIAAMIGPVIAYFSIKRIGFGAFLFERPPRFALRPANVSKPHPAQ
ncbi:MAG: acyltransferase family protein [Pseudomonadota bacterium]